MDLKLKGKRAFISGATQGIGFAIAQQLLVMLMSRQHKSNWERIQVVLLTSV